MPIGTGGIILLLTFFAFLLAKGQGLRLHNNLQNIHKHVRTSGKRESFQIMCSLKSMSSWTCRKDKGYKFATDCFNLENVLDLGVAAARAAYSSVYDDLITQILVVNLILKRSNL